MAFEKAVITNSNNGDKIAVLFNPEEYTVSKDNNFAQIAVPGLRSPLLQFVHGNLQTLEMELLLDSYEQHGALVKEAGSDVRQLTRQFTDLLNIDPKTHAPPVLVFAWASLTFTCVLARATQRFIMFRPDGRPVRARLQVTFNEFTNVDLEAKEIKRETVDYSKIHTIAQGETLSTIAWRTYGDPRLWRPIALRNGLDNPRTLPVGGRLIVPHLPYRDPDTGEVYS
jgi:nucleoid-associated protein YgaU